MSTLQLRLKYIRIHSSYKLIPMFCIKHLYYMLKEHLCKTNLWMHKQLEQLAFQSRSKVHHLL